jgi:hypothetical protein
LDRRTFEGKLFAEFRADLVTHAGGSPNVVQTALIERCAWVRLRLAMMDSKVATGDFTEHDSRTYLAWANTLSRLLARLGVDPQATKPLDPMEAIRAHVARRAAEEAA